VSTIAPGSGGAGLVVRTYRRSPLRWIRRVYLDHRGLTDNDVFLASYPRSGSVWLRFLIYEMTRGNSSLVAVQRDVPYVGWHRPAAALLPDGGRAVKTHEPYLPIYRRAIHLVRDPRDVCLSYFRFLQRMEKVTVRPSDNVEASFERFVDAFIGGRLDAHGTWQSHLFSWVTAAEDARADVLRIRFEDMRADTPASVLRIGTFLGLELSAERAAAVAQRCSIAAMRAAEAHAVAATPEALPAASLRTRVPLIAEGAVEGWRERMTPAQAARIADAFARGLAMMSYPAA
jgi:hypothetical protein